jgi:hypothetical protein
MGPLLRHAGHHRERRLGPRQCLHLALLVHAEHDRGRGGIQVQANNVVDLLDEQRVGGQLEPPARCGLRSTVLQIRPIVDLLNPVRSAIFDRVQCVALAGVDSNVAITTSSTCSALITGGRPGRASLTSPSKRSSTNRERHFPTVAAAHPSCTAAVLLSTPAAHASTIRDRNASACADFRRRDQRSNCSCSSSVRTSSVLGRPVRGIPQSKTYLANLRREILGAPWDILAPGALIGRSVSPRAIDVVRGSHPAQALEARWDVAHQVAQISRTSPGTRQAGLAAHRVPTCTHRGMVASRCGPRPIHVW